MKCSYKLFNVTIDSTQTIQQKIKGAITKASAYIEAQIPTTTDDYTLAIGSYALTLAKRTSATQAFQKLNQDAIVKGIFSFADIFSKNIRHALRERVKAMLVSYIQSVVHAFYPFLNKPCFSRICSTSFLKALWEKEELFVTSNFSFSHSVFYPSKELSAIFIKFEIVVCKLTSELSKFCRLGKG